MITKDEIIKKANSIQRDLQEYEFLRKAHDGMVASLQAEIDRLKEENKELKAINNVTEPTEQVEDYKDIVYDKKTGFYKR